MALADDHFALIESLRLSVAIRMLDLGQMKPRVRESVLTRWAENAVDVVASKGDVIQYRGGKKGETAEAFNALARAVTALAHQPGGVTFAGVHWCADHSLCLEAAAESAARPSLLDAPEREPEPTAPIYRGQSITTVHLPEVNP